MPRFGVSFEGNDYQTPAAPRRTGGLSAGIPSSVAATASPQMQLSNHNNAPSSVSLCCGSPNGKQWHTLSYQNGVYSILSRRIQETGEPLQPPPVVVPALIQTQLPESVQGLLRHDPPKELLCVEAEGKDYTKVQLRGGRGQGLQLPLLCLYSSSSLLLIQMAFDAAHPNNNDTVSGHVVSVHEPLETYLLEQQQGSGDVRIVRVRPAPQRWTGHAVHSPAGCLAVLTHDRSHHTSAIVCLEQGLRTGTYTVKDPVFTFGTEGTPQSNIVDFCFAKSDSLSLLSSMSILLLRASGDVLAASPFVFAGSLVPRTLLDEAQEYLQSTLRSNKWDRTQPQWRQVRAAQQFLHDVFPLPTTRSRFVTAQWNRKKDSAARFPVKLQGPILYQSESNNNATEQDALTITALGPSDLVAFAVGGPQGRVDIGVTAPTTIVPRFALENFHDGLALDDAVCRSSAWVDRVSMGVNDNDSAMALYQDPNFDDTTVLHVVTPSLVGTLCTNAVQVVSAEVLEGESPYERQTLAWSCLEQTPQGSRVQGVVASPDNVAGHKLLVQFTNGTVDTVNVTEEKTKRDVQAAKAAAHPDALVVRQVLEPEAALLEAQPTVSRQVQHALEATPPFFETVAPQIEKVNKGLASMGKVVGSQTRYKDITPDMLAAVASIKNKCDMEVVLPLLEVRKMTKVRKEALQTVVKQQALQLAQLMERRKEMEERNERIQTMLQRAETNKRILLDRTQAAEQASQHLAASTTAAEKEYFAFVELTAVSLTKWEARVEALRESIQQKMAQHEGATIALRPELLDPQTMDDLAKITASTGNHMSAARQTLKEADQRLKAALQKAGVEPVSENEPSTSNLQDLE